MEVRLSAGGGVFGKLIFSAFGLLFAVFGSMFVKQALASLQETKAMQQWVETPCAIVSSEMKDAGEDYKLILSYTYSFNGQPHTATRYGHQNDFKADSVSEISQLRKTLAPGTQTRCHVNPNNPNEAVLKLPTVKSAIRGIGFTLIFPAFGLLFATIPWLTGRRKNGDEVEIKSFKREKSGKPALILFGSIFALAGLLLIKPLFITPLQKANDAKTWNSVPATVISSKVKSHSGDDSTTYSVYIAYRYEVDGTEFIGDQYSFVSGSSSGYSGKADIVRQYPKGRKFTVFVNPINPGESVIQRELSNSKYLGLIPVVFTIIGIAILIGGLRAKRPELDRQQSIQHTVTLNGPSPLKKAIGISLFATVWSGVVVLLAKSDAPLLFPVVFGLFGVIMICASIHAILAVFNPRPTVDLTPGNIHQGTEVLMRWLIDGDTTRIEKLTVKVQCLKITTETSRSGKNRSSRVVKTPLYEEGIVLAEKDFEIRQGTATFKIPVNHPASRPGNTDGIQWQLLFHGDIARWPDLKQELLFIV
ncbi:MAG: DUF3592 domain-containing protein, partial [Kiritimatiellales bacterium]|nr:DUF3592 domain-containing protein [Kiritimatiellales bacterium]